MMQTSNSGRVFVVTGGAGGIGRATAETLAADGARVVITDIDEASGTETAEQIARATGADVRSLVVDVSDSERMAEVAAELESGGWPAFGVVANAGIAPASAALDYTPDLWRRTVDINLNGVFWTVQTFARHMIERGEGAVVITASIAGFKVVSPEKHAAYGATKAAVSHLASLLGVEWASTGVRVNAVAPGYTSTPLLERMREQSPEVIEEWVARTPLGRLITPQEIANAAVFLLSDAASGITATTLAVDGGYSAR